MYFHYYNNNPNNREIGDCVFRALALFLDKSWEDIARLNMETYLETGVMLDGTKDDEIMVDKILSGTPGVRELTKEEIYKGSYVPGFTIQKFIDNCDDRTYFVSASGHVTVVKNKQVWDTWDSSNYSPNRIFVKED